MMIRLLSVGIDLASTAVFLLPVLFLPRPRQGGRRSFVLFLFALYLAAVLSVVGIPSVYHWVFSPSVNVLPFGDILNDPVGCVRNFLLNALLFLPLGFLLPALWGEFRRWKRTLLLGFGLSLAIELLQLFSFRATDLDDLIANTLGTALGFLLARLVFRGWNGAASPGGNSSRRELAGTIALVFLSAMLLQPLLSDALWNAVLESPLWARLR